MSTRLNMYNNALMVLGERSIAALTDAVESRRLLDQVWSSNGVIKCLEEGQWNFATRSIQIDYDPDIDPGFGYTRAFPHPSDYVLTAGVCSDEFFKEPLLEYKDEGGHWYANLDTLYVSYVSSDDQYGLNINDWPGWFDDFVAADFAHKIAFKLTASKEKRDEALAERKRRKLLALNKNMMGQPTKFPPVGSWVRSRHRGESRRDRGTTTGDLY